MRLFKSFMLVFLILLFAGECWAGEIMYDSDNYIIDTTKATEPTEVIFTTAAEGYYDAVITMIYSTDSPYPNGLPKSISINRDWIKRIYRKEDELIIELKGEK